MGKNEFLTPKAIANRIKAKGLQKLRWYCQMCQKQCRDENGFKCHCMSESHQRQMQLFGHNPDRIVQGFSDEFQQGFLDLMRRSHRFSRIAATVVYNEYINDRHHVHMNSTRWATLTEFVKYLGRAGHCKVEETPKGWFITYIDRDSETLFKDRLKAKRLKADLVDEERQERAIQAQIDRAQSSLNSTQIEGTNSLNLENDSNANNNLTAGKVAFLLQPTSAEAKVLKTGVKFGLEDETAGSSTSKRKREEDKEKEKGKRSGLSALDQLMQEEEKNKEKSNRKDYWLCEGIVVKVAFFSLVPNIFKFFLAYLVKYKLNCSYKSLTALFLDRNL